MSSSGGFSRNDRSAGGRKTVMAVPLVFLVLALILAAAIFFRSSSSDQNAVASGDDVDLAGISVLTQPGQSVSGSRVEPAPEVLITDARGRPAAGVPVIVDATPGVFNAGSVTQVATDARGRAAFTALSVAQAGAYRLAFSAPGYPSATSAEFVVRFGIPRLLSVVREPQSAKAGAALPGDPAVKVTDEAGNPVPGINVDALLESPGHSPNKLATVPTDADGLAVFSNLVLPDAGDGFRLKFDARAAGVNDAVSVPFNLTNS